MTVNASMPAVAGRPPTPVQSTMLFRNYDFSPPADSLLAIPADYIKVGSTQKVMLESLGNLGAMMQPMQQLMPAAAE